MGKKWWLSAASLILLAGSVAGCSSTQKADADGSVLEAASVEWTESELNKIDSKVNSIEERTAKLEQEVKALLGSGGSTDPDVTPLPNVGFLDVTEKYWAYTEIMSLYNLKIISGYPTIGKFLPEDSITRAQAAAMLVKALKIPVSTSPSTFSDVSDANWAKGAIMAVVERGYFKGSNGKFMPNAPMKRKHMAVVLQRAFDLKSTGETYVDYKDVPLTDDGYVYIKAMTQNGISTGSNGYFKPYDPTKRSHFSAFLYRALNR